MRLGLANLREANVKETLKAMERQVIGVVSLGLDQAMSRAPGRVLVIGFFLSRSLLTYSCLFKLLDRSVISSALPA